ncbi:MAG: murein L,D-transpeptidase catalytic domain family protein, partial [Myxococcota bacterium]|nr:murein L,D-transpeptidase catalytic domain family protein [Myxococcota bacterium]
GLYFSAKHDRKKKKRKGWPDLKLKKTKTRYNGLRLDGLSITNGESLSRGVVMHEAYYNEGETMGRSYGCPAFRPGKGSPIFEKIQTGSLFYGYAPQCGELMKGVMEDVVGWDEICGKNSKRGTP